MSPAKTPSPNADEMSIEKWLGEDLDQFPELAALFKGQAPTQAPDARPSEPAAESMTAPPPEIEAGIEAGGLSFDAPAPETRASENPDELWPETPFGSDPLAALEVASLKAASFEEAPGQESPAPAEAPSPASDATPPKAKPLASTSFETRPFFATATAAPPASSNARAAAPPTRSTSTGASWSNRTDDRLWEFRAPTPATALRDPLQAQPHMRLFYIERLLGVLDQAALCAQERGLDERIWQIWLQSEAQRFV